MEESNLKDELLQVGKYNARYNDILGIQMEQLDVYRSKGLPAHIIKRKHFKCLKYIDYISEILEQPDYVGINPNETGLSIELVKQYRDNIMLGMKLDLSGDYWYVSTMYDIQQSKIERRLHSGRLKKYDVDNSNLR